MPETPERGCCLNSQSALTVDRPDIWRRGLGLATALTGYEYAPKLPLADGTIYACGYYPPTPIVRTPKQKTPEEIKKEEIERIEREIGDCERDIVDEEREIERKEKLIEGHRDTLAILKKKLEDLKKKRDAALVGARIFVPDGAMEWLLHEVGHWVAATPEERTLQNYGLSAEEYGHDGDREWQAWAFEEIVLAPFGPARMFAPPTQRDGAAFSKAGPMPSASLAYIERQILALGVDVEPWRLVFGEWIRWGRSRGDRAPWVSTR